MAKIDKKTVEYIAKLANIPVSEKEKEELADGFNKTLKVVDELFDVDVKNVEPTHQVTGLENVLREDEVKKENILTQQESLQNTKRKHNGYFVVDQILED